MYRIGNKIAKRGSKLYVAENQTVLEFTVRGTCFPDRSLLSTIISFSSEAGNVLNIDFADGTGVHRFLPNSVSTNFIWVGSINIMHYYQDLSDPSKIGTVDSTYPQQRVIKIWFDYPQRVQALTFQNNNLYGEFPKNIGNYNLSDMRFSGVKMLSEFPIRFRGGKFKNVYMSDISPVKPRIFPKWVFGSEIDSLNFVNVFDLSDGVVSTGIDGISNCKLLRTLVLSNLKMNTNSCFPSTLKDIVTLRNLYIGGNGYSILPKRVTDCTQLEILVLSNSDSNGYASELTSWGEGLGLMTKLTRLDCASAPNMPTTLPPGLENCIAIKNLRLAASFQSVARTDSFVNNFYDFILANASTIAGNTKFRNMIIDFGRSIGPNNSIRPSGGATPTAVVYPATTPIQKVYNMCKTYGHTWDIVNITTSGVEKITPTS